MEKDKCNNNPNFTCPISEKTRNKTCRKTGYCPTMKDVEGCGH